MTLQTTSKSHGVAVALSSSFFGFYTHAGFMASLHDAGIYPGQVAGTSSGALVAALCGLGKQGGELEAFVMQPGMRRSFLDWMAPLRLPGVLSSFFGSGVLCGENVVRFLRTRMSGARLEDFKNPQVQLAVTNLTKRECRLVREGDAAEWIVASCAVPGLFRNRIIQGDRWCDGGVVQHVPFDHWLDDPEVHTIVLHNIDHLPGTELVPSWPTLASGLAACHETITKTSFDLRVQLAELKGKRVLTLDTRTPHPGFFPHKGRRIMIEAGRETGRRAVESLRAASNGQRTA